ncbi:MAG TPA: DNA gyrase subunit A, partial [Kofleriaceae bacterium]|nr:DNA gyrase subunit A [Kofleriaceae bacterium]
KLLELVPGPDFPTGAYIIGRQGIRQAYRTGRGAVVMRAKAEIEVSKKGDRSSIVIDAIPYQVNKKRYENVLGQLGLSVLLRQHKVSDPIAHIAAAGWGGDRLAVLTPPGPADKTGATAVAVIYTVWDTEVDAVEFMSGLEDAMPSLSGGPQTIRTPDLIEHKNPAGTITTAERHGDAVVVIVGCPAPSAADVRAQVWKTWKAHR